VTSAETIRAYDLDAAAYARASPAMPDSVRADIEDFVERIGAGGRVLEIGSGGGRDALLMEELGLRVRRTDITPGFVSLLREQGFDADLLDPLVDDLPVPEGPYDGVWANASLLHVRRVDLPTVLARLARVTRVGGLLRISLRRVTARVGRRTAPSATGATSPTGGHPTSSGWSPPAGGPAWTSDPGSRGSAGSRGSRCRRSVMGCRHEAHGVLGAARRHPGSGLLTDVGRAHGRARARRPHDP
jgi:SAM-dependent methyltransferase